MTVLLNEIERRIADLERRMEASYGIDITASLVEAVKDIRPATIIKTEEYERLLRIEAAAVSVAKRIWTYGSPFGDAPQSLEEERREAMHALRMELGS